MLSYLISLLWMFIQTSYYDASYTMTLGRTGPDCAGRGICGFTQPSGTLANTILSYNAADSILTTSIVRSKLTSAEMLKQFGTKNTAAQLPPATTFALEATYILSQQVKENLDIPQDITHIQIGNYSITQTSNLIIAYFKLH